MARRMTRRHFFADVFALAALVAAPLRSAEPPRVLLAVAHPDDEYTFAATVYRITKELGGVADQVVITDGAGGFHYSSLAGPIYGVDLTREQVARTALPEIRRKETLGAGRILGIRRHYFLNQKDAGFTVDPNVAVSRLWDTHKITSFLTKLIASQRYQFVLTVLPTPDAHGHHQAATWLTLQAVAMLPEEARPAVLGGDPGVASDPPTPYSANPRLANTEVWPGAPVFSFDRNTSFGFNHELNYQIVVNWMIAEHKSQGMFQLSANKHDVERYWLFAGSGSNALTATSALFERLRQH